MGGALANTYSQAFAKLLKDAQDGEIQESDYFYASFDEMYQTMKSDYTKATGLEWRDIKKCHLQHFIFSVSCNGCADLLSASKEAAVGMAARIKLFILLYIQY